MKDFTYVITDPIGIHARPAGALAKEAKTFQSKITITKGDKTADAKGLLGVMGLAAKQGDEVVLQAAGEDEDAAIAALSAFMKDNL